MNFWKEYLGNPPFEVGTMNGIGVNPEDHHCVLWVGYGGEFDAEELWDFGSGRRWHRSSPNMNLVEYGGETLCGLKIESGRNMYGPRWCVFDDSIGTGKGDPALLDLHGIRCMTCRKKLMYGLCRIIDRLTSLRDSVGEDYVQKVPLVHGKHVVEHFDSGGEAYQHCCDVAREAINPQLADDAQEFGKITCPDCIANIRAGASHSD